MRILTSPEWKTDNGALSGVAGRYLRRNFALGLVSGVAYNIYIVVLSTQLVMTWFLSELTDSNLLISLVIPIEWGSWYFLQLVLSGYVQRRPRTLPLYRLMAILRVVALGVLVVAAFAVDEPRPLLIVFLLTFTVNSVAAGVAALPFLNVVAKTIPPARRGIYFGWRRFAGGLLGLLGGVLVKLVLDPDSGLVFPHNYGVLFFLGFWITVIQVATFSLSVEPPEEVAGQPMSLAQQVRHTTGLVQRDRNFGRYLGLQVAFVVTNYALPFYAVYARQELEAPEDMVGIYVIGLTLAGTLSNLVLGRIGDLHGNRLLVRLAALTTLLPPLTALLVARLPGQGLDKSLVFILVFLSQGLYTTADVIGNGNYLLELSASIDRVIYIGLAHGVVGLALFTVPLGGVIVDWLGFEPLFLVALVGALASVALSLKLEEPRQRRVTAVS
jgi:MFS family permease